MKWRVLLVMVAMAGFAAWPASAEDGPVCADCHDEAAASMTHNIHMRIEPFEVQGRTVGCEACHGDGTQHMEEGDAALIRTFSDKSLEDGAVCSTCHTTKSHSEWAASTHAAEGMTCLDCHGTHTPNKPLEACKDCHADTMAELQLPSHHPVREGKMTCVSCHDPHAATEAQLRTEHLRPNDLCFSCHMDKEGPFIFEHEPVVEDCRICHTPHGSVANNLLTANEPMLCLQCHEIHFHAGLKSPEGPIEIGPREIENPQGMYSMNATFTTRCSQCHSQVHGSDLPSNSLAGGGHGMTR